MVFGGRTGIVCKGSWRRDPPVESVLQKRTEDVPVNRWDIRRRLGATYPVNYLVTRSHIG